MDTEPLTAQDLLSESERTTALGAAKPDVGLGLESDGFKGLTRYRLCQYLRVHTPPFLALVLGGILLASATLLALFLLAFSRPSESTGAWNRDGVQSAALIFGCTVVAVLAFWWLTP